MSNRRKFLKHTGGFALGSLLFPAFKAPGNLGPIGVQLWSVKDVLENDLKGTLQKLASIGYKEIESFPGKKGHYYGMEPKEFKTMLNDMGLKLVSSHFGSGSRQGKQDGWQQATMLQNLDELVAKAAETGQKYLTCS